jgi:outer membrane protein assembly factor BamB
MPSRRRFLATSATVTATGLAGCSALPVGDESVPLGDDYPDGEYATASSGWSTYRRDGANTACAVDASPIEDPSIEWESPRFPSVHWTQSRTLTVDGATVYTGGDAIRAFDLLSGEEVWAAEDVLSSVAAPDVHDGVAWTRAGTEDSTEAGLTRDTSTVVGLDVGDGEVTDRREFTVDIYGQPSVAGRTPYLVAETVDGGVAGTLVGEATDSTPESDTWSYDVFADGAFRPATTREVAVTSFAGEVYRFSAFGYPVWRTDLRRRPRSSPVVGATRLYVATEHGAVALDRETGQVDWEYDGVGVDGDANTDREETVVQRSGVAFDGARLFLSGPRSLHAVSAETGERLWRHEFDERPTALPAVGGGRVYVGTDTEVHALDVDGTHQWEFDLDDPLGETLAVTGGRLLTLVNRGRDNEVAVVSLA